MPVYLHPGRIGQGASCALAEMLIFCDVALGLFGGVAAAVCLALDH